jgi:hypothetical protein
MDIGDEPVNTFPGFCGKTLLSPQRKFYIVVAQQGPTIFLHTEMFDPNIFIREFDFVDEQRNRGQLKHIVPTRKELNQASEVDAHRLVPLSEMKIGDKVARKSDAIADYYANVRVCGIYDHFVAVAETRTVFLPGGDFAGTGWTVIKS